MKTLVRVVFSFMLACAGLWAQATTTSTISGTVRDATGLAVPDAEIKATQTETGLVRTVNSGAEGGYLLTNLPIGPYQLQVSKAGFSTYVQTGIVLQVNSNPEINVGLKVGAVSEQVQVEASAALVETQSTSVGSVVENQRIVDLPLNGRNPQDLLLLAAPAVSVGNAGANGRVYPGATISVAGSTTMSVLYELDGVDHSSLESYTPLPIPFPDALQEFKLETSSMPARYGHHSGAVANIVTKTGTNDWHGDAFEYFRNGDMNARNFFGAKRDSLKRNQFGGVLGGPVIKNKMFFFFGYQDTIQRSDPGTTVVTIPTAADLAGNFTVQESPACNSGKQINLGAPFVGNQLSPGLISPITAKIASWLPSTPVPNQCGTISYGFPNASDEKHILARVDYQKSDKQQMFARFFTGRYNVKLPVSDATKNLLAATTAGGAARNMADTAVVGDTYLISPTTINTFRASAEYIPNNFDVPSTAYPADVGIKGVNPLATYPFFGATISGSILWGSGGTTRVRIPQSVGQVTDDIDMTRGSHQIAFGFSWATLQLNNTSNRLNNGELNFSGALTGTGLSDFVAGLPNTWSQGYAARDYQRGKQFGVYVQDGWKITKRLTLNYGLRWEPFLPSQANKGYPFVEQFSMANFLAGVTSKTYANAPAGMYFNGDAGWNQDLGEAPKDWKIFSPRMGLVFDPRGQGKEVIRLGYGIFYDVPGLAFQVNAAANPPFGNSLFINNPDLSNPYGSYPGGAPFPYKLGPNTPFPLGGTYNLFLPNNPNPYTQQWNVSFQKQFSSDWSVTLSYLGNETTHQWYENEINPAIYIPGNNCNINGVFYSVCSTTANTEQRRYLTLLNPTWGKYYSFMQTTFAAGTASYNGAVVSVQKRFAKNVSASIIYTWSHCISIAEPGTINNHYDLQDPSNANGSRGDCTQDIRHNFNSSFVFTSPKFSNAWVRRLAGNWQLSPIIRILSGFDSNPLSGKDYALNGTLGQTSANGIQRPNYICDPNSGFTKSLNEWFNVACVTPNATGQFGNSGKNSLRGPGALVVNVALSRRFPIRERQSLEFRAEAFNLPNTANFAVPTTLLSSTLFGKITSTAVSGGATTGQTGDPRIMQLALKYSF